MTCERTRNQDESKMASTFLGQIYKILSWWKAIVPPRRKVGSITQCASLRRRSLDFPFLYGIVSGLVGIFSAFTVALFIVRKAGMWEPSAMFLGLTLPLIGEFQYFERRFRLVFTREDRRIGNSARPKPKSGKSALPNR
jgi:hypothetical protein